MCNCNIGHRCVIVISGSDRCVIVISGSDRCVIVISVPAPRSSAEILTTAVGWWQASRHSCNWAGGLIEIHFDAIEIYFGEMEIHIGATEIYFGEMEIHIDAIEIYFGEMEIHFSTL